MEDIDLEHFKKYIPSTVPMAQSNCSLWEESDQDASTTALDICITLKLILSKGFKKSFLTTMWYHTDGCSE